MPTENIDIVLKGRDDASRAFNAVYNSSQRLGAGLTQVTSGLSNMRSAASAANKAMGATDFVISTFERAIGLGKQLNNFFTGDMSDYESAMKRAVDATDALTEAKRRQQAVFQKGLSGLSEKDQLAELEQQLRQVKTNRNALEEKKKHDQRYLADLNKLGDSPFLGIGQMGEDLLIGSTTKAQEKFDAAAKRLKEAQDEYQKLADQIDVVRDRMKKRDEEATRRAGDQRLAELAKQENERAQHFADRLEKENAAKQQQLETDRKYIDSLRQQAIALRDGADAAAAFAAKRQGVSDAAIQEGMALRTYINTLTRQKELQGQISNLSDRRPPNSQLTAYQSRTETGGGRVLARTTHQSAEQKQLAALKAQLEEQKKIAEKLREQQIALDKIADNTTPVKEEVLN